MSIVRLSLLGISALSLVILLIIWIANGRSADILLFLVSAFLIVNVFYLSFSTPTFKPSDFFARAATGLAVASLELQQQAKEAQVREAEMERLRAAEADDNKNKLKAAEEFLIYLRRNLNMNRSPATDIKQITAQREPTSIVVPALEKPRAAPPTRGPGPFREPPVAANEVRPAPPPNAPAKVAGSDAG